MRQRARPSTNKRLGLHVMLITDPLKHVLLVIASRARLPISTILLDSSTFHTEIEIMSFVRTNTATNSHLVSCDGARTTHWQTPRSGNSVLEIQTYPDSSKVTEAQRAQLGKNPRKICDISYVRIRKANKIQRLRFIGTGIKKSISLSHKGASNTALIMC